MIHVSRNDFPITNLYLKTIVNESCALKSIIAKVSCLVFPLFILLTFFVDLVTLNTENETTQVIELNRRLSEDKPNNTLENKVNCLVCKNSTTKNTPLEIEPKIHLNVSEIINGRSIDEPSDLHSAPVQAALAQELPPPRTSEDIAKVKRLLSEMSLSMSSALISLVAKRAATCSPEEFAKLTKNITLHHFKDRFVETINVTGYALDTPENCQRALQVKQLLVELSSTANLATITLVANRAVACSPQEFVELLFEYSLKDVKNQLVELIHITGYPLDTPENCEQTLKVKQLLSDLSSKFNLLSVTHIAKLAPACTPEEFAELICDSSFRAFKDRFIPLISISGF